MKRHIFFLFLAALTAVSLAACAVSDTQPTATPPPTAAPTLPAPEVADVVTVTVATPGPTETPVACTPLPPGMSLRLIPTSEFSFQLEATGLLATESLTVIISGSAFASGFRDVRSYPSDRVVDGRFNTQFDLRNSADISNWEAQIIHAQGVACLPFSLPLPADPIEIAAPGVVEPAATPEPPPFPTDRALRSDQTIWFAQGDALWRSDVHGVELDQLTSDDFLGWQNFYWYGGLESIRLSPDGRWLANYQDSHGLHLVDVGTRQERVLPVSTYTLAWSPDSRFLAYAPAFDPARPTPDCALCLYDLVADNHVALIPIADPPSASLYNLVWSPDGEKLAYACCLTPREPYEGISDGRIEIVAVSTGEREMVGTVSASIGGGLEQICWTEMDEVTTEWERWYVCSHSPTEMMTAFRDNLLAAWEPIQVENEGWRYSRLFVTNLVTGQLLWEQTVDSTSPLRLAWSLDGRYLFFDNSEFDSPIWRVTADGENLTEFMADGYLLGVVLSWEAFRPPLNVSPDGRWRVVAQQSAPVTVGEDEMAAFPSGAKYQVELYVESTDSDLVWEVVDEWRSSGLGADAPGPLQWSADGRYLFFSNIPQPDGCSVFVNGGDLWRLDLQTGEAVQLLPFVGMTMALSPDSRTLAYYRSSYEANFHLYDLASGAEIALYLPDYGDPWQQMGGISWSPDGRQILLIQVMNPCGDRLTAVSRLDLDEGEFVTLIEPGERNFTLLNWLRDREIRLLDGDGRLWYLETNSGEMAGGRP